MTVLLIATRNAHKATEVRQMLTTDCLNLDAFPDAPSIAEVADTFAGNAALKAQGLARWLAKRETAVTHVLADDSGLEVDALDGAPGIHSARFASNNGTNCPDAENNTKLLQLLEGHPATQRTARFRCVLALVKTARPDSVQWFKGTCEGTIAKSAAGKGGFGYDPLFVPQGHKRTFAELGSEIKNQLSHRAAALARLKAWQASV